MFVNRTHTRRISVISFPCSQMQHTQQTNMFSKYFVSFRLKHIYDNGNETMATMLMADDEIARKRSAAATPANYTNTMTKHFYMFAEAVFLFFCFFALFYYKIRRVDERISISCALWLLLLPRCCLLAKIKSHFIILNERNRRWFWFNPLINSDKRNGSEKE